MKPLPPPVTVGVIGCGTISDTYFTQMATFPQLHVVACADIVPDRAAKQAEKYGLRALTVADLLAATDIELIVNLTVPSAHAELGLAAIAAGKSVYNEKPLALTTRDGQRLLDHAAQAHVLVGSAPDTFLGAGLQTARQLLDDGHLGTPIAALASFQSQGPERWHHAPEFFYAPGGGPMFDMGPYYLTALVALLGPVRRVGGVTKITHQQRTIKAGPRQGTAFPVTTPTHITGILEFVSGAVGTIVASFDTLAGYLPALEISGTTGALKLPDPNTFGGPVGLDQDGQRQWQDVPLRFDYHENHRGLGVADLADALRTGTPARAGGQLGLHVVEIMEAFEISSQTNTLVSLTTTCERPAPMSRQAALNKVIG